jgi:hypothetical protein
VFLRAADPRRGHPSARPFIIMPGCPTHPAVSKTNQRAGGLRPRSKGNVWVGDGQIRNGVADLPLPLSGTDGAAGSGEYSLRLGQFGLKYASSLGQGFHFLFRGRYDLLTERCEQRLIRLTRGGSRRGTRNQLAVLIKQDFTHRTVYAGAAEFFQDRAQRSRGRQIRAAGTGLAR